MYNEWGVLEIVVRNFDCVDARRVALLPIYYVRTMNTPLHI